MATTNGHCKDQKGGCLEFQLIKQDVKNMQDDVKGLSNKFWAVITLQIAALGGLACSAILLYIKG